MSRKFLRLLFAARLIPILIGISLLPVKGMAQEPSGVAQQPMGMSNCKEGLTSSDNRDNPILVTIEELRKNRDNYYGKTVTVDGDIHRTFTDNVFTIEDKALIKDPDVLVISTGPMTDAGTSLDMKNRAVEKGKRIRLTGVVQPYDRGRLECAYGPLHLESREGHSFTRSPVVIVDKTESAKVEMPAPVNLGKPMPPAIAPVTPEPAKPEPPATEPAKPEAKAPESLPKTAGDLPLLALAGLLSISGALLKWR
jgi:hypothetical protein